MPELSSAAVYGVGETMVKGEADIALHQIPELMAVSRIEIVGPLPSDLHSIRAFSGRCPRDQQGGRGGQDAGRVPPVAGDRGRAQGEGLRDVT